jgi:hypothetical protein
MEAFTENEQKDDIRENGKKWPWKKSGIQSWKKCLRAVCEQDGGHIDHLFKSTQVGQMSVSFRHCIFNQQFWICCYSKKIIAMDLEFSLKIANIHVSNSMKYLIHS